MPCSLLDFFGFSDTDLLSLLAVSTANKASTDTVSPSSAIISDKTPEIGAGTSTVTLSVSSSHIISSMDTTSPGFLNQVATVASVTDSPSVGTLISVIA